MANEGKKCIGFCIGFCDGTANCGKMKMTKVIAVKVVESIDSLIMLVPGTST
jgi:hypothetical protein